MPGMATATPDPLPTRRRRIWRWALCAVLAVPLIFVVNEAIRVTVGFNFHTVIPRELYRCAQPSEGDLERLVRDYGVRTVVNLRGRLDGADWYEEESRACQRLGVSNEVLTMSATRLPARHEVRRLIEILDRAERPIVLHCRQGADRTGLATAIAMLLRDNVAYADAKASLGLRCGHWPIGPTANLSGFFDEYEGWLASRKHTPELFREWVNNHYTAGPSSYEILSCVRQQAEPKAKKHVSYLARFKNTSNEPWQFRSIRSAGVHVCYHLYAENGMLIYQMSVSLMDKVVAPGEEVEVVVPLGMFEPGRYLVRIDLREEHHGSFSQCGQEPFEEELIVRE